MAYLWRTEYLFYLIYLWSRALWGKCGVCTFYTRFLTTYRQNHFQAETSSKRAGRPTDSPPLLPVTFTLATGKLHERARALDFRLPIFTQAKRFKFLETTRTGIFFHAFEKKTKGECMKKIHLIFRQEYTAYTYTKGGIIQAFL